MKNLIQFDDIDKKIALGLSVAALFYIVVFSLYWGGGFIRHIESAFSIIMVILLPGYIIYKLYLTHLSLSDNPIADRLIISFTLSLLVIELPFFLMKYLRPYEDNTDEKAWGSISDNPLVIILVLIVIGGAIGYKYYKNNKEI